MFRNEVRKLAMCRHKMPRPFGTLLRVWNNLIDRLTGFSAIKGRSLDTGAMPRRASAPALHPI